MLSSLKFQTIYLLSVMFMLPEGLFYLIHSIWTRIGFCLHWSKFSKRDTKNKFHRKKKEKMMNQVERKRRWRIPIKIQPGKRNYQQVSIKKNKESALKKKELKILVLIFWSCQLFVLISYFVSFSLVISFLFVFCLCFCFCFFVFFFFLQ